MINDLFVFASHDASLKVELKNGNIKEFVIPLNMQLQTYLSIMANLDLMEKSENGNEQIVLLANAVFYVLHDKRLDIDWIIENISIENMQSIIAEVTNAINKLLENEIFELPKIEVKRKSSSGKKDESEKKRATIENLYKQLEGKINNSVLDDIAMLITKTNNSYWDVVRMPILVYRDLVKIIMIDTLKQDDDYHLAWLEYEKKKLNKEQIKTIKKSSPKKASLEEIARYFS